MFDLEISKFGRPVVFVADVKWDGGQASNRCLFARRRQAMDWAKDQASLFSRIDWSTWTAPQGEYPEEIARDNEALNPSFVAKWDDNGGGAVQVTRFEVENAE